jgi:hypothetical protein
MGAASGAEIVGAPVLDHLLDGSDAGNFLIEDFAGESWKLGVASEAEAHKLTGCEFLDSRLKIRRKYLGEALPFFEANDAVLDAQGENARKE